MRVVSTNVGLRRKHIWKGKEYETGIYKYPVEQGIRLEKFDVEGDNVVDRKNHGGLDKACYLYSYDHYPFWQERYPSLAFHMGMMGENITVEELDEKQLYIGDVLQIGRAKVEISQPRQPCKTLGIKFNDQGVIKRFLNTTFSGCYVRIIEAGNVTKGDSIDLLERKTNAQRLDLVFNLIVNKTVDSAFKKAALNNPYLATAYKATIE